MKNSRVRQALKQNKITEWELADLMGISEASMTRWMRYDHTRDEQMKCIDLIRQEAKRRLEHE